MVSFVLLLLCAASAVSASCPSQTAISPCSCVDEESYIEVECHGEDISLQQLKTALDSLGRNNNILLILNEMDLGSLPSNIFEGLKIFQIEIERCIIESLNGDGGKPFTGLENTLRALDIVSSFTEEHPLSSKLDLSHLKELTDLHFYENSIDEVGNDWFKEGPHSLIRLVFSNNGIEKLGDRVFEKLNRLQVLTVEGNRFGPLKRSMLPNTAEVLDELDLDNNGFTDVPEDIFHNMPSLERLSLQKNGLIHVREKTFKSVWEQLELIDLRDNPLACDSNIDWLTKLKKPKHVLGKCQSPHNRRDLDLEDLIKQ